MNENNQTVIRIKKLRDNARIPSRGSASAAGYDLCSCTDGDTEILPSETAGIGTGIAIEIPEGFFGAVFARSGLAMKQGLRPANCVGVIDSDYRGEIVVAVHNDGTVARTVHPGDRIAQIVIMPYLPVLFEEAEELDETERGAGGFGSTGV